jgi:uncharacterized protein YecT (DUF1311 family)
MSDAVSRTVSWPVHRLFLQCAILLLISMAQIHAQTQAAMNAQAHAEFKQADAELNKTYQAPLAKLPDAQSKQKLKEIQRGWIASRDADAARAADQTRGGSMALTIRYETMTELTRQRTEELKAMLEKATSDKGSASTSDPSISPALAPSPADDNEAESPAESDAAEKDSSTGLPEKYAKDYLIARSTMSPDKKFAVIYPNEDFGDAASEEEIKNYLVRLKPFTILRPLDTDRPYFEHQSHGGLSAEWSDDSSVGLITIDAKWGPGDVLLVEFHNGKVTRMTNILRKAHDLLLPVYQKNTAERYNDSYDFLFMEDSNFELEGTSRVLIDASVQTSPNDLGLSPDAWNGHVKAVWDIAQAKFTSKEVSGRTRGADAYRNRGQSAAEQKQSNPADDIKEVIGLEPNKWDYYLSLAWYHLFDRNPREATAASLKALELSPRNATMIKVVLAHSYLFDNQFDKAKAIYLENKSAKLGGDDERSFSQAVLDDFKELEEAGMTHPDMEKIKALLTTKTEAR